MVYDILISYILQIIFTIGLIILFGFLIGLCNKVFYNNLGQSALKVCYITGAIGTPIHECAHALLCLIFGHKITEIKLFQINSGDGTLGYVKHTYNKKNIYHRIGNFFIGIAPIIVISGLIFLLAYFLLPNFIIGIKKDFNIFNFIENPLLILKVLIKMIESFLAYITTWQFWVFIIISMFLALHMTLSKQDIKIALDGILFLLILGLIIDIIMGIININILNGFTKTLLLGSSYLLFILVISLLISIIEVLLSFIFKFISRKGEL